ncbi:LysM peptidoglycan-binding domain-containing protein [Chloroflexi bacterium TSY]|nr:LysM peptidoglycan-binding domain-containing protein [Chloroflexi bacterium TSY]
MWGAPVILVFLFGAVLATWGAGPFALRERQNSLEVSTNDNRVVEPQVTLDTPIAVTEQAAGESVSALSQDSVDESEQVTIALATTSEQDALSQAPEGMTEEATEKETNTVTLLPTNTTQSTETATQTAKALVETPTPKASQVDHSGETVTQNATQAVLPSEGKDGTRGKSTPNANIDTLAPNAQASIDQQIGTDADQGVITIASLRATQQASEQRTTTTALIETATQTATRKSSARSVTGISIALNTATPTKDAARQIALEIGGNTVSSTKVLTRLPTNTPTNTATATRQPTSTPSATSEPTSTPTDAADVTYVIRGGDTLLGIARQFDTTVEALMATNSLTAEDVRRLRPGSKLVIPDASPAANIDQSERLTPTTAPLRTYVIQSGDTPVAIAQRYGISVQSLLAANNLTSEDARRLRTGQELVVPTEEQSAQASLRSSRNISQYRLDTPILLSPEDRTPMSCRTTDSLVWGAVPFMAPTDKYILHLGFVASIGSNGEPNITWILEQVREVNRTSWDLDNNYCGLAPQELGRRWHWWVQVVDENEIPVSLPSEIRTFSWN